MPAHPAIEAVEVAPPGFINFRLAPAWLTAQANAIANAGETYGNIDGGPRRKIQVEFVSANPTGPLHVGNGRWATIGSTLANALRAAGHEVATEYYVNDAGTQTETFARTLLARYRQQSGIEAPIPEDGYPGDYMIELARSIKEKYGERFLSAGAEAPPAELRNAGIDSMTALIRNDLASMGVTYDRWYDESSLYDGEGDSRYSRAMAVLREQGYVAEREGAVWFTSTALGEEKDNVLIRSDGIPTYFAADIAYHYDKFILREFDPGDRHLGRRPPGPRVPRQGGRRRAPRRPGPVAHPAGAARHATPRRRTGAALQTQRKHHHATGGSGRGRGGRLPLLLPLPLR